MSSVPPSPRRRRRLRWLLLVLILPLAVLVHTLWPLFMDPQVTLQMRQQPSQSPRPLTQAMAGLAEVDITPPVGLPKFGYSAWAETSTGFRTRLKARAFYLAAPDQAPMALIVADLGAGSRLVRHRVAERVSQYTDIPFHAVSLLVTHTHSAPGQFMDSDFYNTFGANRPGLDVAYAEFLSRQLADAVIEAWRQARPARFAWGHADLYGFTRNRSIEAWARNFDLSKEDLDVAAEYRAVNPRLSLLRIDQQAEDGYWYPAGALSAFSIHGTAIPGFTGPVHADVWHWIAGDVSQAIQDHYAPPFRPLHGAFQATHGDNTPAWNHALRGPREAKRIGAGIAAQAFELFRSLDGHLSPELQLGFASREIDLFTLPEEERAGLCRRALVGSALLGSARGDEVFPVSWLPWLRPGQPARVLRDACHGAKHLVMSRLQYLLPRDLLPHVALLQVIRLNDQIIVAVPWEVTLESGNRMREAIRTALPPGPWQVEISSLANGYFGYATTEAEYEAQYYEGGHTLYGPHTTAMLARQSARLVTDWLQQPDRQLNDLPEQWSFVLRTRQYFQDRRPPSPRFRQEGAALLTDHRDHPEAWWEVTVRGPSSQDLWFDRPLLRVERAAPQGGWQTWQDDESGQLEMVWLHAEGTEGLWRVRWYQPPLDQPTARWRLVLEGVEPLIIPLP